MVGIRHRRRRSLGVAALVSALVLGFALVMPTGTASAADDVTTFRVDAIHSGGQPGDPLRPPLARRWWRDLGGPVYFPLIVGDTVYVVAGNMPGNPYPNYGSRLFALSLVDGHTIWGPIQVDPWGGYYFSGLTYDGGRLFVITGSDRLEAIDPATGTYLWPQPVALEGGGVNAQPTAYNGIVYITSVGNQWASGPVLGTDANVTAVRESDGTVLWVAGIDSGDFSAPVVTQSGVYVTNACYDTWDFDPLTGARLWKYEGPCFGGGGTTPALWQGRLYVRDSTEPVALALDPATGSVLGQMPTRLLPAFNGSNAYLLDDSSNNSAPPLEAWNVNVMAPEWKLAPPSGDWFNNAPVCANGYAYTSTHYGRLIAADATGGGEVWSDDLGVEITGTNNMALAAETSGIAIGEGSLLIPVNTALVAYSSGLSSRGLAPEAVGHATLSRTPPPPSTTPPSRAAMPPRRLNFIESRQPAGSSVAPRSPEAVSLAASAQVQAALRNALIMQLRLFT